MTTPSLVCPLAMSSPDPTLRVRVPIHYGGVLVNGSDDEFLRVHIPTSVFVLCFPFFPFFLDTSLGGRKGKITLTAHHAPVSCRIRLHSPFPLFLVTSMFILSSSPLLSSRKVEEEDLEARWD